MTILLLVLLLIPNLAWGQLWSDILSSNRGIDWTVAGAGTIPARTTICATLTSSATAADINTAIQSCPTDQSVFLSPGTYSIGSPGITNTKSNVTLRGAGANSTFLNFTGAQNCGVGGGGSGIYGTSVCIGSTSAPSFSNTATWTAGYAKGSTTITVSSKTNMQVGTMLLIGQALDGSDPGDIYNCQGSTCTYSGGIATFGSGTEQGQMVTVTSISGGACPCTIGISPSVNMPNVRVGQSPTAKWPTGLPPTGIGLEDMSLDFTNIQQVNGIMFLYVTNSWVKGVRSISPGYVGEGSHHIRYVYTTHITTRHGYFWGLKTFAQESYGLDPVATSELLVENNIFQNVSAPVTFEGCTGCILGYNYTVDNYWFGGTSGSPSWWTHALGNSYILIEGNDGLGVALDNYHGPSFFVTAFRNRFFAKESDDTSQTSVVYVNSFNRYANFIGNVLGNDAHHNVYQARAGTDSSTSTNCTHAIFAVGWGDSGCLNGTVGTPNNDTLTVTSLMRWGNYDTVNDATRFVTAEVPTTLSPYGNPEPASQSLPVSFYLSGRPSWWSASIPFPAIGPDVTGGSESGVGGHNALIPARRCADSIGVAFGQRVTPRAFDASTCYPVVLNPASNFQGGTRLSGSVRF